MLSPPLRCHDFRLRVYACFSCQQLHMFLYHMPRWLLCYGYCYIRYSAIINSHAPTIRYDFRYFAAFFLLIDFTDVIDAIRHAFYAIVIQNASHGYRERHGLCCSRRRISERHMLLMLLCSLLLLRCC